MYESQSGVEYWKKLHNSVAKQISVLLEERRGELTYGTSLEESPEPQRYPCVISSSLE